MFHKCTPFWKINQIYELTLQLKDIRQYEGSVTKYFDSLKKIWQGIDLFNDCKWKSPEDYNYKKRIDVSHIFKFLEDLINEYRMKFKLK